MRAASLGLVQFIELPPQRFAQQRMESIPTLSLRAFDRQNEYVVALEAREHCGGVGDCFGPPKHGGA